jgi:hypothetical protein
MMYEDWCEAGLRGEKIWVGLMRVWRDVSTILPSWLEFPVTIADKKKSGRAGELTTKILIDISKAINQSFGSCPTHTRENHSLQLSRILNIPTPCAHYELCSGKPRARIESTVYNRYVCVLNLTKLKQALCPNHKLIHFAW